MGSFCSSKPQTTNTSQTQTYTPNAAIAGAGNQAIGMAQNAASQPFQMPAAPVAGFNPFQQQAFDQYQGMQGGTDPYFQNASANMTTAQSPVTQGDISSFMNPYAGQAMDNMKKYVFDPQRTQTMGAATQRAGGVGADRLALTSQNLDKTQADAVGQAQAGFYGQALNAAQQSKQQAMQSAQGWANLGIGQQGAGLQATGALAGAGAQQQAQSQREMNSPYQQMLAQIAFPYQNAQFLAGITGGLAGAMGGTTNGQGTQTTTPAQPSLMNQIFGMGLAGAGMAGSAGMFGGSGGGMPLESFQNQGAGLSASDSNPSMYADGGEVEEPSFPGVPQGAGGLSPVPYIPLQPGASGQSHNNLDLNPKKTDAPKSGGGFGDTAMKAASMAMMFLKDGGSVNPWDTAKGYATDGRVEEYSPEEFNPIDAAAPPQSFNSMYGDRIASAGPELPTITRQTLPPPRPVPTQSPWDETPVQGPGPSSRMPPRQMPGPYPTPDSGGLNADMKVSDYRQPRSEQPYPDALDRDWGQKAARSPWMSLVHAGAKMAQSTKSGVGGLGEGIEAGAHHLDTQRKELRSEQQINQKSDELYRHAKSELDKYTRKTPHQLATEQESTRYHNIVGSLGQSKIENAMATGNLVYAGPVKDEPGMGYFYDKKRLDANGQPAVFKAPFDPGEKPGTVAKSGRIAAHELYKKLYPGDERGAQDILLGHKTMTKDDVRKRVESIVSTAMKAQAIQPGTTEWLTEHKRRSDELMQGYGQ